MSIQVHGLEKSYGQQHVLRGVDLDVARGSIFALLGPTSPGSGASKHPAPSRTSCCGDFR